MPIADDIEQHYPDDWEQIRERVLQRAAEREETEGGVDMPSGVLACGKTLDSVPQCEWCGKPHNELVLAAECGSWAHVDDQLSWFDSKGDPTTLFDTGPITHDEDGPLRVILTIAHLDHDPRDTDLDRLRALCQRCHLTYDNQPEQRARRERVYAELRGQMTLLEDV